MTLWQRERRHRSQPFAMEAELGRVPFGSLHCSPRVLLYLRGFHTTASRGPHHCSPSCGPFTHRCVVRPVDNDRLSLVCDLSRCLLRTRKSRDREEHDSVKASSSALHHCNRTQHSAIDFTSSSFSTVCCSGLNPYVDIFSPPSQFSTISFASVLDSVFHSFFYFSSSVFFSA